MFLEHTAGAKGEELEREMFILRKVIEKAKAAKLADGLDGLSDFYICTMSSKTIVYKVRRLKLYALLRKSAIDCKLAANVSRSVSDKQRRTSVLEQCLPERM